MFAPIYLCLTAALAYFLQFRVALLDSFQGVPRYLCSLGLTLFLATWTNFLLYALVGWGGLYLWLSWGGLLLALLGVSGFWKPRTLEDPGSTARTAFRHLRAFRQWNLWFLALAVFVAARFYAGLDLDDEGNVWSLFNFVDTAFHLSVVRAFLAAPQFPPMDLNMAPYPLKYHFLADFQVAHLTRLGLPALSGIWLMNVISALAMVGALWAAFERWLRLPPRWIMLAGLIFLFLNTSLINLIHYLVLRPEFFYPEDLFHGLLRYPYYNFESILTDMLEPQRGLLFSLPIALLVLHAAFGGHDAPEPDPAAGVRTLQALILVCLLPLSHIVAFAVLVPCLLPQIWRHRAWLLAHWWIWLPAFVLGLLQLGYLTAYGPPPNAGYALWSSATFLPFGDFAALPSFARGPAFWFFVDGDFLFWGLLFAAVAFARRRRDPPTCRASGLWQFLLAWRWYFAVCGFFFALVNFYRYSFDWGDNNKLVLFLNLGLSLVIVQGAAQWIAGRRRTLSLALWGFFFVLCVAPPSYRFYLNVIKPGHGVSTVLLFEKNGRRAAEWIKANLQSSDLILTAAYNTFHFVTPLAGRPTLAGIYGASNAYRQDERWEEIRRVYENGELGLLPKLGVQYVCISRNERRKYQLSSDWIELMNGRTGVVFQAGEGPEDFHSVYIFDCRQLPSP